MKRTPVIGTTTGSLFSIPGSRSRLHRVPRRPAVCAARGHKAQLHELHEAGSVRVRINRADVHGGVQVPHNLQAALQLGVRDTGAGRGRRVVSAAILSSQAD